MPQRSVGFWLGVAILVSAFAILVTAYRLMS